MAGQRLMTSGGWATSSRLSSLVIYHICFSGETGPSLTLSRTRNAIKLVLQETLRPFTEVGRERGALLVGGGARHQQQGPPESSFPGGLAASPGPQERTSLSPSQLSWRR